MGSVGGAVRWVVDGVRHALIKHQLCEDGARSLLACAECESPCRYGIQALREMDRRKLRGLLCGGDCGTCRQPCNLRKIVLDRGIRCGQTSAWLEIALRPQKKARDAARTQDAKC